MMPPMQDHSYFTYIMASRSHTLYIGVTSDLRIGAKGTIFVPKTGCRVPRTDLGGSITLYSAAAFHCIRLRFDSDGSRAPAYGKPARSGADLVLLSCHQSRFG